jgi:transcriptional regulator with XRE-family HTH domain
MTPSWELLRAARQDAGLSQSDLAGRMGTSQAAVAQLERVGSNPKVATLARALRATGQRLELDARPHKSSVDETLLVRNLALTPAERLANFRSWHRGVGRLRNAAARSRG